MKRKWTNGEKEKAGGGRVRIRGGTTVRRGRKQKGEIKRGDSVQGGTTSEVKKIQAGRGKERKIKKKQGGQGAGATTFEVEKNKTWRVRNGKGTTTSGGTGSRGYGIRGGSNLGG